MVIEKERGRCSRSEPIGSLNKGAADARFQCRMTGIIDDHGCHRIRPPGPVAGQLVGADRRTDDIVTALHDDRL